MEKGQRRVMKTNFVFVHGLGHGAWCWYKVITTLISLGYKATALDLAASGVYTIRNRNKSSLSPTMLSRWCTSSSFFRRTIACSSRPWHGWTTCHGNVPKENCCCCFCCCLYAWPWFPFLTYHSTSTYILDFLTLFYSINLVNRFIYKVALN